MSDSRFTKRYLKKRGEEKSLGDDYIDNRGNAFDNKIAAILSSVMNFFAGCLLNGFPVVVPRLWYSAWAFYPFFFVRKNLGGQKNAIAILNHERIHCRQQRELYIVFGIPMIIWSFWNPLLWIVIPFIPALFFMLDIVRCYFKYWVHTANWHLVYFHKLRELTCFEQEAASCMNNEQYLMYRGFFNFIKYR